MRFFRRIWFWIRGYEPVDVSITAGVGAGQSRRCWVMKYGKWRKGSANIILEIPWDIQPSADSAFQAKTKIGLIRAMKIFSFLRGEEE